MFDRRSSQEKKHQGRSFWGRKGGERGVSLQRIGVWGGPWREDDEIVRKWCLSPRRHQVDDGGGSRGLGAAWSVGKDASEDPMGWGGPRRRVVVDFHAVDASYIRMMLWVVLRVGEGSG